MIGIIYEILLISNGRQRNYIGSTMTSLNKRLRMHKIIGNNNFDSIIVHILKKYDVFDSYQLKAYEQLFINKYKPVLNKNMSFDPLMNKCIHVNRRTHCSICCGNLCPFCKKKYGKYYYSNHKCCDTFII